MAEFKRATRYRVAYHPGEPGRGHPGGAKASKTDLIVVLEGGSSHSYPGLAPDAAHHLIDLLRNEDPVWVDRQSGMLIVADEPVGAGEQP
ncbi:MAG: hypothetical protein ABIJ39_13860 [Chloroflexota bacterium]